MAKVPRQLHEAAQRVRQSGSSESVMVKELLDWFKAQRRGMVVVREIRAALKRVKLVTVPDFEVAYINQQIKLKAADAGADKATRASNGTIEENDVETTSAQAISVAIDKPDRLQIGMLQAANTAPATVSRNTKVTDAITKMLLENCSQLPVMQGERADSVKGLISWRSIGWTLIHRGKPEFVSECIEEDFVVISSNTDLLEAFKTIAQKGVVLVKDNVNRIVGLVTTSDISLHFGTLSEPFLLMREIENSMRRLIDRRFSLEEIEKARDPKDDRRKIESVANLTLGECIRFLDNPANWERMGYDLARFDCIERLREVGRIRNEIMHFHPDPIADNDVELLRETRKFLEALR